jgi:pyruvate dehydrogenase E1 component
MDLAKPGDPLGDRIVTTAPDVTQTTNLGGFVNRRGLFRRSELKDVFHAAKIPSAQKWSGHAAGQHIELGIAENNFFLMLAALGLSAPQFGTRLLPVGTVYDPFISRGLDALNYGCYQDARFLLVGTPSGLTLGAEGGAHQSINTPLIGMGQPNLTYFEPAFADEVALTMAYAFDHMQKPDGSSVYLRLSTRTIAQVERANTDWEEEALKGGYWLRKPGPDAEAAIIFTGAIAPEAIAGWEQLVEDMPGLGLLNVTSPDLSASRLVGAACGALDRRHLCALPCRGVAVGAGARRRAGHGDRWIARRAVVAGRRQGHAGQPARHRPFRPDRRSARPLSHLQAGCRRHRRSRR